MSQKGIATLRVRARACARSRRLRRRRPWPALHASSGVGCATQRAHRGRGGGPTRRPCWRGPFPPPGRLNAAHARGHARTPTRGNGARATPRRARAGYNVWH